jgi:hypothetical protein
MLDPPIEEAPPMLDPAGEVNATNNNSNVTSMLDPPIEEVRVDSGLDPLDNMTRMVDIQKAI